MTRAAYGHLTCDSCGKPLHVQPWMAAGSVRKHTRCMFARGGVAPQAPADRDPAANAEPPATPSVTPSLSLSSPTELLPSRVRPTPEQIATYKRRKDMD